MTELTVMGSTVQVKFHPHLCLTCWFESTPFQPYSTRVEACVEKT